MKNKFKLNWMRVLTMHINWDKKPTFWWTHTHLKLSRTYNIFPLTKLHLETIILPYKYFKTFQDAKFNYTQKHVIKKF